MTGPEDYSRNQQLEKVMLESLLGLFDLEGKKQTHQALEEIRERCKVMNVHYVFLGAGARHIFFSLRQSFLYPQMP